MRWLLTLIRIVLIILAAIPFSLMAIAGLPFDKKGTSYFWSGKTFGRFVLFICGVHVTIKTAPNIAMNGNYIIVSNHASMFDIPVMLATFPSVRIMFKKELGYVPIWGWALWWGHHIIVDRSKGTEAAKSLARAAKAVKQGGQVLLFAEGTRTRDGKLQPFKRGAFSLAAKSGVPIIPVTLNGTFKILPKGSFDIRPAHIEAVIDLPIETTNITSREEEVKLMKRVEETITKNYNENF